MASFRGFAVANPLISIIDDDEAVRRALVSLVRSLGYRTDSFASAEEFLASESALSSQCIITDIQMPGLTGVGLKRRLDDQACTTPVIMITARNGSHLDDEVRRSGALCLVRKPFEASALVACIQRALSL